MSLDALNLPQLTKRQEEILGLIVRAYSQKPEPVSSKYLMEKYDLNVSSATIRNEMALLEELGYVTSPHTSAGRIPTEIGYRYFVKHLTSSTELSAAEQTHIAEKFLSLPLAMEQWMRQAATVLARTVQTASLVTPPISEIHRFKHVELISIQGRLVLMVLVLEGGSVHQRMLNLSESIPQRQLSEVAARLNALCPNLSANEVRMKSVQLPLLDREVAELAAELLEQADKSGLRMIYREGLSDIINAFPDHEGAQQAVRVLEERAFLEMILGEVLSPIIGGDVQVLIAGEGRWEEISQLSMVLSRYGIPGQASGAIGVLGPTRINYGRAISTVRYLSTMMTNMMVQLYQSESDDQNPEI